MNFKRSFLFIGDVIVITVIINFLNFIILDNLVGKVLTDTNAFISLVLVKNNGAAFNIFAGYNVILIIFAVAIILYCIYYTLFHKFYISEKFLLLLAFFCSGIIGNTYERIANDYVLDYIKLNIFDFPVFNLNDILITLGAILIVSILLTDKYKEYRNIKDEEEEDLYRDL